MNESSQDLPYSKPDEYLAQGDIFSTDIVTPFVETKQRIFRAASGRQASAIALGGEAWHIFDGDGLIRKIASLPEAEQIPPFDSCKLNGIEYVVTKATLTKHFAVVSQTCDICGVNGNPQKPVCVIAPIRSLAQFFLETLSFPYRGETVQVRIIDYMSEKLKEDSTLCETTDILKRDLSLEVYDDFAFVDTIKDLLGKWQPQRKSEEKAFRGGLKTWLKEITNNSRLYFYYLPKNEGDSTGLLRIPESIVDFSQLFSIQTFHLEERKDKRCATLKPPYEQEFAKRVADYYSRVATPTPMKGDSF